LHAQPRAHWTVAPRSPRIGRAFLLDCPQQSRLRAEDHPRPSDGEAEISMEKRAIASQVSAHQRGGLHWILALVAMGVLGGGCDRSEQLRSTLEMDQAGWNKQVSGLKARVHGLEERFKVLSPPAHSASIAVFAQRRRVEATVVGARQSLVDLERTIDDGARDVDAAIGRNEIDGEQALAAAVERIGGYVRQQEQNVAAAETALSTLGKVQ
jgi:hypothetical protein